MPEHLTWFKWESYSTWLSGFAMLVVAYWFKADLFLIDPSVSSISALQAVIISGGSLIAGWLVYDFMCRSHIANYPTILMLCLYGLLVGVSLGFSNIFSGKAALIHLGAITATIMTANVFLVIMPNQRIVVADLKAGRKPDAKFGKIAKLRSTHNNYLTLPVIFLMLSIHYPLAFGTHYSWLIASIIFIIGVLIRHYFNAKHARKRLPLWTWGLSAVLFVVIMWLSTEPFVDKKFNKSEQLSIQETKFINGDGFKEVQEIISARCTACHSENPVWNKIFWPPKGLSFQTDADIVKNAHAIFVHSGISRSMPPGNVSGIEESERSSIRQWYNSVIKVGS